MTTSARPEGLSADPHWYKDTVIYELRVRSFHDSNGDGVGDLQGLTQKLDYLQDLGVSALWLLPICPSPGRDDGYDISDYMDVHPEVGNVDDFKAFLAEAHRRGIRVITELVLNHTSDQHAWFQRARRAPKGSKERDFYVWSDTPDRYRDARIIFKDFEPSNWSWDHVAKQYFWHRFFAHQPDLNFENPAVHEALFQVVDFWFDLGVDGLRLDAVPYLYEEEGTSCENLPRTHEFLRKLRAHVDQRHADKMLLAEANQWPEDAARYFGDGDECHMNFHFPIMPRLFMSMHMEDRFPILDILAQTPRLPESAQWALFLRNHDELTLEMVTDEERDYMYKAYASETPMRINLGIRRRLAPLCGNDRRRMELMNALLLSLPGTPVLYYGDEIGMGDNVYLGDRNGVRTPMQWSADRNAGFSRANPQRLILPIIIDPEYHYESINVEAQQGNPSSMLWWTKRMLGLRRRYQAFGRGSLEFLHPANPKVLAFLRRHGDEEVLVVANLSRHPQYVELDLARYRGLVPVELVGKTRFPPVGELPYLLTLGGYGVLWFSLERQRFTVNEEMAAAYVPPTLEVVGGPAAIFEGSRDRLEALLPAWLERRAWFVGRERGLAGVTLLDVLPVEECARIVLARARYVEGDPEDYSLPLLVALGEKGEELTRRSPHAVLARLVLREPKSDPVVAVLADAMADGPSTFCLLEATSRGVRVRGKGGELRGALDVAPSAPPEPRLLRHDHENASSVFGNELFLRYHRRPSEGTEPEVEIGRHLAGLGAPVPALLGTLEYRTGRGEPITLATVQSFVPAEIDAGRYTRAEVSRFLERALARPGEAPPPVPAVSPTALGTAPVPPELRELVGGFLETVSLLGRRTAELHLALARPTEDPAFTHDPYSTFDRRSVYQTLRNLTGRILRDLRARLPDLTDDALADAAALLEREERLYRRFEPFLEERLTATRGRLHGDLHLGKALWTGRDFVFVDFAGPRSKPLAERRRKRSPLRDVAAMLRSFHYAAATILLDPAVIRPDDRAVAEPWALAWRAAAWAAFLGAYLDAAAGASFVPKERRELGLLLDSFVLGKALEEVAYELDRGARKAGVALLGLPELVDAELPGR